jgi:hypothetical protein
MAPAPAAAARKSLLDISGGTSSNHHIWCLPQGAAARVQQRRSGVAVDRPSVLLNRWVTSLPNPAEERDGEGAAATVVTAPVLAHGDGGDRPGTRAPPSGAAVPAAATTRRRGQQQRRRLLRASWTGTVAHRVSKQLDAIQASRKLELDLAQRVAGYRRRPLLEMQQQEEEGRAGVGGAAIDYVQRNMSIETLTQRRPRSVASSARRRSEAWGARRAGMLVQARDALEQQRWVVSGAFPSCMRPVSKQLRVERTRLGRRRATGASCELPRGARRRRRRRSSGWRGRGWCAWRCARGWSAGGRRSWVGAGRRCSRARPTSRRCVSDL